MIVIDCEQGSGEWLQARAGVPTASRFGDIVDTKWKRRTGQTPLTYLLQLAAEQYCGRPADDFTTFATERGQMLEQDAIPYYCLTQDAEIDRVGFVKTDDGIAGCSPDGLWSADAGGIEVKCPHALSKSGTYIAALTEPEKKAVQPYAAQVHGVIWICELEWCDLVFYHPDLPKRVIRVHRDEDIISDLSAAVREFAAELTVLVAKLRQLD